MHIDVLLPVVDELASLLVGARVDRVIQGRGDTGIYIFFSIHRNTHIVLLSPQRSMPRLHLVSRKPQSSDEPHPFILNLRSRLIGTRLADVVALNQDRIVEMRFSGGYKSYSLIFELTGSSANLFFTDEDLRILSVYYPVSASDHSQRLLLPGSRYTPLQKKTESVPPQRSPLAIGSSANRSVEEYYEHLVQRQGLTSMRAEIRSALRKAVVRTERRLIALNKDMAAVQDADGFRKKGDLILANLHRLKTGMEHADLMGYDGTAVSVLLDPKRSPSQNAELYFRKYKKAKKGQPLIQSRLISSEEEMSFLRLKMHETDEAGEIGALLELRKECAERGYLSRGSRVIRVSTPKAIAGIKKIIFREWEIYIGKSAAGNDYLTKILARPDDFWLHAEGLPGSHVLIKNPRKTEIPREILLYAASLAARHSKGKHAAKVPVTYTSARYVSKPKGAKPGLVMLSQRKTVMVRPADDEPQNVGEKKDAEND